MRIEIVEFGGEWAADFARLNYEWIETYFSVEKHDREILDDPQAFVIARGGRIFMAVENNRAVGTVAMIPDGEGIFELTKMAVSPVFHGRGISNLLMQSCIDFAERAGAKKIFLESHRSLTPALSLYRKFEFTEVPIDPNSEYARADIRMELAIIDSNM